MKHRLYIGLGSNMGDRKGLIMEALRLVGLQVGRVLRVSALMESEPWGFESENRFMNAAALVETRLSPHECLWRTQHIERMLGRTHKSTDERYADGSPIYHDRPIDIDLLRYDDLQLQEPDLVLPHPHIEERDFVSLPLQEITKKVE